MISRSPSTARSGKRASSSRRACWYDRGGTSRVRNAPSFSDRRSFSSNWRASASSGEIGSRGSRPGPVGSRGGGVLAELMETLSRAGLT